MGKLGAALQKLPKIKKGPRCGIATLLGQLSKADGDELRAAIKDADVMSSALETAIASTYQSDISQATIARHRRGHCSCRG